MKENESESLTTDQQTTNCVRGERHRDVTGGTGVGIYFSTTVSHSSNHTMF